MDGDRFIDRPMSITLDALRFLFALGVLTMHTADWYGRSEQMIFSQRLSRGCVIGFFVLSGLVIADSALRRRSSLRDYAIARAARILPVAVPTVLLSAVVYVLVKQLDGPLPDGFAAEGIRAILTSLVFMNESPLVGISAWGNTPYWSLCYEVWYYALFGAGFFLTGAKRIVALCALGLLAGFNVLLLFPLWLAGAWLTRSAWARSLSASQGVIYLVGCMAMLQVIRLFDTRALFALREVVPFSLSMSEWVASDYPLAATMVVGLAALRPLANLAADWLDRWERPIRWLASFSFSLYLVHFPLLALMVRFGPDLPEGPAWIMLPMGIALVISAGFAQVTERHSPQVRRWLDRVVPGSGPRLAVAGA